MRFAVLQQVGGGMFAVYDIGRGEIIKTYDGKYARELAAELCGVLERGSQTLLEAGQITAELQKVPTPIQSGKK